LFQFVFFPKCATFKINTTKNSWFLTYSSLLAKNGGKIPQVKADTTVSYLGRRISPWTGLTAKGLEGDFTATLQRVE
jgi:hypothetical protein